MTIATRPAQAVSTDKLENTEMYGWRARIGLILPADNVVMEPELNALGLEGISFHGLRLTATEPELMRAQALELADTLRELGVDIAVYACTETSFNGGGEVRKSLSGLIESRCGVPVVTATNAMLAAVDHMGLTNVSVVTPYTAASGLQFEEVLKCHGIKISSALHRDFKLEGTDSREWYMTNRQSVTEAYSMVRSSTASDAHAVVIAATNLATLQVLDQLELDLGKPVLSTNQALLWWCYRTLSLSFGDTGVGSLLRTA